MIARRLLVTGVLLLLRCGSAFQQHELWHVMVADSLAGSIGGMAKTIAVWPLDVRTTRREARYQGSGGWHRGLGVTLALCPAYACLFHSAYAVASRASPAHLADALGGASGSVVAVVVGVPMECVKHRLQLGASLRAATRAGLYDGLLATLARNLPYNVVVFASFQTLKSLGCSTPLASLAAGLLTAIATHPIDLVNTRIQAARLASDRPPSVLAAFRAAATQRALFDGLLFRCLAFPPASLVFFSLYHPLRLALLSTFFPLGPP